MTKYDKRRQKSIEFHNFKYKNTKTPNNTCVYCGEPAEVYDHVPPVSLAYQFKGPLLKVPACKSCNKYLNNFSDCTLYNRRQYIKNKLCGIKDLSIPAWSNQELKEVEEPLRSYIKKGIKHQKVLRRRILYLLGLTSDVNIC